MNASLRPRLPRRNLAGLFFAVALGRRRSFAADCRAMVAVLPGRPTVEGLEHVPPSGPLCVVANHYQRPGLWIGWTGAVLADAVGIVREGEPPLHFFVIADLRARLGGRSLPVPFTGWAFGRVAHAWGMIPMPSAGGDVRGRAAALREMEALLAAGSAVALFPEGTEGKAGAPGEALRGVGRWLQGRARAGVAVVPAAVREQGGTLHARFGAPLSPAEAAHPMAPIAGLYTQLGEGARPRGS